MTSIFFARPATSTSPTALAPEIMGVPTVEVFPSSVRSTLSKVILSPLFCSPWSFSMVITLPSETLYCFPPVCMTANPAIIRPYYRTQPKKQGAVRFQNYTPLKAGYRDEASCEASRRVVPVPVVLEPVPVQQYRIAVLDEIRDVEVAIAAQHKHTECHPCHHPLNTLGAVSYSRTKFAQHS